MSDPSNSPCARSLPWDAPRACVLGDVMLDAYMWGSVTRRSPEAPVPVVDIAQRERRVGGAANVVKNLYALGAQVDLISVVGQDGPGQELQHLLEGMCRPHLIVDAHRPTTVKTRVISDEKHVLRVDEESTEWISDALVAQALGALDQVLSGPERPDVVVVEDYDKGMMSPAFVKVVLARCREAGVPVAVDPKFRQFGLYEGVALFKPNLKELNEGLRLEMAAHPKNVASMKEAVEALMAQLQCERLMVTLGEHGTWMHAPLEGIHHQHLPALPRNIKDVSGAGDTVIAVAALLLASGCDASRLAALSNLAGGWVCERVGVVPISKSELEQEWSRLFPNDTPSS